MYISRAHTRARINVYILCLHIYYVYYVFARTNTHTHTPHAHNTRIYLAHRFPGPVKGGNFIRRQLCKRRVRGV